MEQEITQWDHHEGSIQQPIIPLADVLPLNGLHNTLEMRNITVATNPETVKNTPSTKSIELSHLKLIGNILLVQWEKPNKFEAFSHNVNRFIHCLS